MELDHQAKAMMLEAAFFPPPPDVDLSDMAEYTYAQQLTFPAVTEQEVERAIKAWNVDRTCA
jgi:hypothetical protein